MESICGKVCSVCKEFKEWTEYVWRPERAIGVVPACRKCMRQQRKKRHEADPEKHRNYVRKYRAKDPEKCNKQARESMRRFRERNPEHSRQYWKNWRDNNPDKMKKYNADRIRRHKEHPERYAKPDPNRKKLPSRDARWLTDLTVVEDAKFDDEGFIVVRCRNCREYYRPSKATLYMRYHALNGGGGEQGLYCSQECKDACPIFYQKKYPRGNKPYIEKEVLDKQVRLMCLERDNYTCQRCGITQHETERALEPHHIIPKGQSPMEANDLDNLVTLCHECHKWAHTEIKGCGYQDIRYKRYCATD